MSRLALPKSLEACLRPDDLTRITLLAQALADAMGDVHGGNWLSHVSHDHGAEFALVRPDTRRRSTRRVS